MFQQIKHTVRHLGTTDCEVKFRLTPEQVRIVRQHYKIDPNHVIRFGGRCEVYAQGNGCYVAWCTNDIVDGALRAVSNISVALAQHAQRLVDASIIQTNIRPYQQAAVDIVKQTARRVIYTIPKKAYHVHSAKHTQ